MLKLEDLQHEWIARTLKPQEEKSEMTAEEKSTALELLRDPKLLERMLADFEQCGVVGEETNKLVSYLAAVSRLLENPLAVVVQSVIGGGQEFADGSGAGLHAGRAAGELHGHDRASAVLHGARKISSTKSWRSPKRKEPNAPPTR